jgi:hypothetical protein
VIKVGAFAQAVGGLGAAEEEERQQEVRQRTDGLRSTTLANSQSSHDWSWSTAPRESHVRSLKLSSKAMRVREFQLWRGAGTNTRVLKPNYGIFESL